MSKATPKMPLEFLYDKFIHLPIPSSISISLRVLSSWFLYRSTLSND